MSYDIDYYYIKHIDKWRGNYYLKPDLTFTTNKKLAGEFFFIGEKGDPIINGDSISINHVNNYLVINEDDSLAMMHFDKVRSMLVITDGTTGSAMIQEEVAIYFISDLEKKKALKYFWDSPEKLPTLINGTFDKEHDYFLLELTNKKESKNEVQSNVVSRKFTEYKEPILIMLLLILLFLCFMVSK